MDVKHSLLDLNDSLVNVGLLLREQRTMFSLEVGKVVPSTYIDDHVD